MLTDSLVVNYQAEILSELAVDLPESSGGVIIQPQYVTKP